MRRSARRWRMRGWGSAVLAVLVLAGCAGSSPDSFTVPQGAGDDATQAGVSSPYALTIVVREETADGPVVANAAVVVANYTSVDTAFTDADGLRASAILALRTDESGRATARLAPDQNVLVAAGGVSALTDERLLGVRIGAAGASGEVTLALLRARAPVALAGVVPNDIIVSQQPNPNDPAVIELPFAFHADPSVNALYLERLKGARMDIVWNNTPTEYADLYLGARVGEESFEGQDARNPPLQSSAKESIEFQVANPMASPQGAALVLLTAPSASVGGVPFAIAGEATFENPLVRVD